MTLARLRGSDGSWSGLETHWRAECERFGEAFEEFATERVAHARQIVNEPQPDQRYGVFGLDAPTPYAALLHINRAALPGTTGHTLRLLWIQLAPKFDFDDVSEDAIGDLAGEIIFGAVELAQGAWTANHVKLHIGNFADRRFFLGIAKGLQHVDQLHDVAVKGNWLHLSLGI